METKKTNTELLKEAQNIAEEMDKKKSEVELLLKIIDDLEIKYYNVVDEVKKNSAIKK